MVQDELPECKLIGEDANVFGIMARVYRVLKRAGLKEEATAFSEAAFACQSYQEVLNLCGKYVEVV